VRFISHIQGDVDRSQATIEDQESGTLHPLTENIRVGCFSHGGLENPVERKSGEASYFSQILKPAATVQVPVYVQHHPLDAVAMVDDGGVGRNGIQYKINFCG
jgi:hypothetical protein